MTLQEIVLTFLATISYGVLFSVPRKALLGGGVIGVIGWFLVDSLTTNFTMSYIPAALIASSVVATISQIVARWSKLPSTNYSIAGIIPLVPGALAYRTMQAFVEKDYIQGLALATETTLIAGALSAGLMISVSIFSIRKGNKESDGSPNITRNLQK